MSSDEQLERGKQIRKQLEEYAKQVAEIHRQTEQLLAATKLTGETQQMPEQLLGYKQHDSKQEEFLTFDNMKGVL